jgi:uncharacterized lipoprotein YddW (UPF0748 family)
MINLELGRFTLISGIVICLFLWAAEVYPEQEVRGLWVVRDSISSPEKIAELVNYADSLHCNVLFVQVRGRGDAYYRSAFAPGPEEYPLIPGTFDPLAVIIDLAHNHGIEVHAWLNMYIEWSDPKPPSSPIHLFNLHPDWFMVDRDGRSMAECPLDTLMSQGIEGRFLSPFIPEVREHLTGVVEEIVKNYPVDGIHVDYIRYPGLNYDFRVNCIRDFRDTFGIDPRILFSEEHRGNRNIMLLEKWTKYRAEPITRLIQDISTRVRSIDDKVRISAAVKPDIGEASIDYGQDWTYWVNSGIVDFVVTMSYFLKSSTLNETLAASLPSVNPRKVIGGIGVFQLTPESVSEQITWNRKQGLLGYCLFSYGSCKGNPEHGNMLKKECPPGIIKLPPEFKHYLRRIK